MSRNILSLVALLCLAEVASAQSIRGQVFVPTTASERIQVNLEKPGGQLVQVTYSDTEGNFFFYNTPPSNDYLIVVKLDGYQEVREALYFGAAGTTNIKISLVRKAAELPEGMADPDVISMAELRQRYPKRVIDEYEDAQEQISKGNTDRAVARLEALLKQVPDFFQVHNTLGTVYQRLARFEDAEREYNLAVQLNPQFALPLVNLAGMYIQRADDATQDVQVNSFLDEADRLLRQAVRLNPASAQGFFLLGTVAYKFGEYAEAEQNLKRALELDPSTSSARLTFINLYSRQQRWQEALDHLDAYLAAQPNGPTVEQLRSVRVRILENLQAETK